MSPHKMQLSNADSRLGVGESVGKVWAVVFGGSMWPMFYLNLLMKTTKMFNVSFIYGMTSCISLLLILLS